MWHQGRHSSGYPSIWLSGGIPLAIFQFGHMGRHSAGKLSFWPRARRPARAPSLSRSDSGEQGISRVSFRAPESLREPEVRARVADAFLHIWAIGAPRIGQEPQAAWACYIWPAPPPVNPERVAHRALYPPLVGGRAFSQKWGRIGILHGT